MAGLKLSLLFLLAGELAYGGFIPGRWEKVESLLRGTQVRIILKAGDRIDAAHLGLTARSIRILEAGSEREIPKDEVQRIEIPGHSGKRGALVGLIAGGAVGAILGGLLVHAMSEGTDTTGDILGGAAIFGGIFGGIGAGAGYGIGRAVPRSETLYVAR